jgi:beta-lactam-binding protein with PASTA domain
LVPILVTVCVLLLVGLLGLGSWLIFASRPDGTPATTPTVQNVTVPATTAAQTTTITTTPPPTELTLPNVRGLDYETAAAELTKLGFIPVRRDEIDGEVPAGKVVGTDPPDGTPVLTGTRINIIVSLGLPAQSSPAQSPSPTASST